MGILGKRRSFVKALTLECDTSDIDGIGANVMARGKP